jgi:cytochrome d ubiquinol oxidase subunit II
VVMFWVAILAVSILLYVLLDGFDLGVGILFGLPRNEERRRAMLSAVAPMWDGNETWLVVAGVILWGAFPIVYATLFSAFYLPLLLMLAGLILRGVAFEYRNKTERLRWIWDVSFAGGSLAAAFIQGLMVGALVEGLPITNGHYTGGEFGWFSPFAVLCGIGLCLGYSLLGACWLVRKCEAEVREAAYSLGPCDFKDFVAQSHTPNDHCVRFVVVVTFHNATLVTRQALPLSRAGLSPAGPRQLRLAHR